MGALDSFEALQAWADATVEHRERLNGRGECTLGTLAGELSTADERSIRLRRQEPRG
ncbi:hypothetical protein [Actinoplanes sp. NBRC 103695]|uniref:hypothetical protein n=1 Tax=Actinoplanes sp. NBRC 103695 TaxID=3032202 RepID=UPI0024A2F0BB|nr:hypothetical protein [Actinoplanes sp. NBRC 103695]GLY94399.1 hypothetical protein Acsp02_16550 [Actinoplanes sp. NBRC 103695]